MSSFCLKLIAMAAMAVDHTGALLFPEMIWLRLIGRLAFPIYCFLLSEGFFYTSSRRRYFIKLAVWGSVSEPVFDFVFYGAWWYPQRQNVFLTLLLGMAALWLLERFSADSPLLGFALALFPAIAAELFSSDYGAFGVVLIVLFYACRRKGAAMASFVLLNTGFSLSSSLIQASAAAAVFPLWLYNGKRGIRIPGWLFYAFYPFHLLLLGWLQRCFF